MLSGGSASLASKEYKTPIVFSTKSIDMAPFTAWLPPSPNQDFDLIVNIVGTTASALVKDWTLIAQSLIRRGLSVMTQRGRLDSVPGNFYLRIRISTRPFYSMGHGCDVLIHLNDTVPEFWRFGLQPGSVLLWEAPAEQRPYPILPEGVIGYSIPFEDLFVKHGEGLQGKGVAALGVLLHLLGVPDETLRRWTSSSSAPRSFASGIEFARRAIEKRDGYSLPMAAADARSGMMLSPEQAILLGYAVSSCTCLTTCARELIASPVQWTAKHLGIGEAMVSMLESDEHPEVQAYRGSQGKVLTLLRGDDSAIASHLHGFRAPRIFLAADIPDTLRLLIAGHDLIRSGHSDGVGVLLEDTLALSHQTVEVSTLVDILGRRNLPGGNHVTASGQEESAAAPERDGDAEADVGFVAWGATQGLVRDAVALCRGFGLKVAALYPKLIVPFRNEEMESFAHTVGRVVLVESGQTQGYWDRLRGGFSFEATLLTPQPGMTLTPMDIFLREGLGAV